MGTSVAVNTAISSAALASSAAASAAASNARTVACAAGMRSYDAKTATVQEMRVYADCVNRLYPTDASAPLAIKIAICFILACALIGAVRGWFDEGCSRIENAGLFALGGVAVALVVLLIVGMGAVVLS